MNESALHPCCTTAASPTAAAQRPLHLPQSQAGGPGLNLRSELVIHEAPGTLGATSLVNPALGVGCVCGWPGHLVLVPAKYGGVAAAQARVRQPRPTRPRELVIDGGRHVSGFESCRAAVRGSARIEHG